MCRRVTITKAINMKHTAARAMIIISLSIKKENRLSFFQNYVEIR